MEEKKELTYKERAELAAEIAERVKKEAYEEAFVVMQIAVNLLFQNRCRLEVT